MCMCGRFALDDKVNALIEEYVAAGGDYRQWAGSWNIKPTTQIPILFEDEEHGHRSELARWSLVAPWAKDLSQKFPTFNARSENITEKATWKNPVKTKRAIVPATGYFEWVTEAKTKTPNFIYDPAGEMLGFAGLYSWWKDPSKEEDDAWLLSTTILTMATVPELAHLHDRNPVTLPRDFWDEWTSPTTVGDQTLVDAAVAAAIPVASALTSHQVAPLTGNDPSLIEPVS